MCSRIDEMVQDFHHTLDPLIKLDRIRELDYHDTLRDLKENLQKRKNFDEFNERKEKNQKLQDTDALKDRLIVEQVMNVPAEIRNTKVDDWKKRIEDLPPAVKVCKNIAVLVSYFDTLIPENPEAPRPKAANDFGDDDDEEETKEPDPAVVLQYKADVAKLKELQGQIEDTFTGQLKTLSVSVHVRDASCVVFSKKSRDAKTVAKAMYGVVQSMPEQRITISDKEFA